MIKKDFLFLFLIQLFQQQKFVFLDKAQMNPLSSSPYQMLRNQKFKNIDSRLVNFQSHKQKVIQRHTDSQEYRFECEMQLKNLIHQWLDYEQKINHQQPSLRISKLFISRSSNQIKQLAQISDNNQNQQQKNIILQNNPLSVQLVGKLYKNHPIFKKINFNLAQTLINIGIFSLYKRNQSIPYIFYNQKQKNKCNEKKRLGFVIYGKFKLIDKPNNYQKIIDQNDCIGQHGIQTLDINFSDYRDVIVKTFTNQAAILWITKSHYEILFKQSMKCGLKEQLRKLQSHLKMSWIKKAIKKF